MHRDNDLGFSSVFFCNTYKNLLISDHLLQSIFYNQRAEQLDSGTIKDAAQTSAYKVVFNN